MAREMFIEGPAGSSYLPIEMAQETKHALLDVADIFVYSIARDLSQGRPLEYPRFSAEVLVELVHHEGEELILGGNNFPNSPQQKVPADASALQRLRR